METRDVIRAVVVRMDELAKHGEQLKESVDCLDPKRGSGDEMAQVSQALAGVMANNAAFIGAIGMLSRNLEASRRYWGQWATALWVAGIALSVAGVFFPPAFLGAMGASVAAMSSQRRWKRKARQDDLVKKSKSDTGNQTLSGFLFCKHHHHHHQRKELTRNSPGGQRGARDPQRLVQAVHPDRHLARGALLHVGHGRVPQVPRAAAQVLPGRPGRRQQAGRGPGQGDGQPDPEQDLAHGRRGAVPGEEVQGAGRGLVRWMTSLDNSGWGWTSAKLVLANFQGMT